MFMPRRKEPPIIMQEAYSTNPFKGFFDGLNRGVLQEDVLTDQENARQATFLLDNLSRFNRPPIYNGGFNIPGAPGNYGGVQKLAEMTIAANYTQPPYSFDTQQDIDGYNRRQMNPAGASFDPNELYVQPRIQPGDPGYNPFRLEQDRDLFILNDPRSGVAQLPGNEQGPPQGPVTPIRYYEGMGYGPAGPQGGGLPPTPHEKEIFLRRTGVQLPKV